MTNNIENEFLMQDIKEVVANAENLLAATEGQSGEKVEKIRERLKDNLCVAKKKLSELELVIKQKAKETARATDEYVHENPWKSVGVAAGVGLILGIMLGRK